MTQQVRQAWIALPSDEAVRAMLPADRRHPYDFGFVAGMTRLVRAHPRIGPALGALFAQVMFAPGFLERREREMIAAVTAAAQDCTY